MLLATFLQGQPRASHEALRWVALGGTCWEYAGQSGAGSGNAAPAEEEGFVPLPSSASAPSQAQSFRRLCTGTIWALINRIIFLWIPSSLFHRMLYESGWFDFTLVNCQGCVCRARDATIVMATSLIPSDMGHILKLGETQHGMLPFPSAHTRGYIHYCNTSPTHWERLHALDIP